MYSIYNFARDDDRDYMHVADIVVVANVVNVVDVC